MLRLGCLVMLQQVWSWWLLAGRNPTIVPIAAAAAALIRLRVDGERDVIKTLTRALCHTRSSQARQAGQNLFYYCFYYVRSLSHFKTFFSKITWPAAAAVSAESKVRKEENREERDLPRFPNLPFFYTAAADINEIDARAFWVHGGIVWTNWHV